MRAVNASDLFGAMVSSKPGHFAPCFDCYEIQSHPLVLIREGKVNRKSPILIGNARYEHGTVASHGAFGLPNSTISAQEYAHAVDKVVKGNATMAAAAVALYSPLASKLGRWYALATMNSHSNVGCGQQYQSTWLASLAAFSSSLYRYVFTHATRDWPNRYLNATHTAELPYLFRDAAVLEFFP